MNDPEVVRCDEGLGDLPRNRERVRNTEGLALPGGLVRERLTGDELRQRPALDELHDDGSHGA